MQSTYKVYVYHRAHSPFPIISHHHTYTQPFVLFPGKGITVMTVNVCNPQNVAVHRYYLCIILYQKCSYACLELTCAFGSGNIRTRLVLKQQFGRFSAYVHARHGRFTDPVSSVV